MGAYDNSYRSSFVVLLDTASSATNGSRATNQAQTVSYGGIRRLLSVHFVVSIRHGIFSYQCLSCDQIGPNSIQWEYRFSEFQDGFKLLAVNSISVYAKLLAVISLYVCAAATDVLFSNTVASGSWDHACQMFIGSYGASVLLYKCSNTVASRVCLTLSVVK